MEIEGKIIQELPMQSGVSKAGNPWKKREWVLETFGTYPRKVKFHVFGDKGDAMNLEVGNSYALSFDLESREFNGRWYTDVNVYQARPFVAQGPGPDSNVYPPQGQPGGYPQQGGFQQPAFQQPENGYGNSGMAATFNPAPADPGDDLPF